MVELLEVNQKILWGTFLWLCPPGVFNSQSCPHKTYGNSSIIVLVFLLLNWIQWWFLQWFLPASLLQLNDSLIHLPLQSWEQYSALHPPLCYVSKKGYGFLSLYSSLFLVRTQWQIPSCLYAEPETQNLSNNALLIKNKNWFIGRNHHEETTQGKHLFW